MFKRIFQSIVLGLVCTIAVGSLAADTLWLTGDELKQAVLHGISLSDQGEYHVWLWSEANTPVEVRIAGQTLTNPSSGKSRANPFSWKKAGIFNAVSSGTQTLTLISPETQYRVSPEKIGYLLITQNADVDPQALFEISRVFANNDEVVQDRRVTSPKSMNDYFTFPEFRNKREWLEKKAEMEDHIRVSMGAYPQPRKTPLNPHIFGRIERDGYSVEKVHFEVYPGFFATGNLYRPLGKEGPFPAILSPHGHWSEGRLANTELGSVPGRAISLARQGHIVFTYDMVGYVDSKQVSHRNSIINSPHHALWGISMHGLQFWVGVRAVDFLTTLSDVDPDRIACTGASGGGTQTFTLMAVDTRVQAAAPVNMISSHYQGGCVCENAPNLRIHNFNVEFAAMMAPRPLLMISASGDWTDETPWLEYPMVRSIYEIYGVEDRVESKQIDAPHNYNQQSREVVYAFFAKWLLGDHNAEKYKEQPFQVESEEDLRVFPGDLPENAVTEEQLANYLISQAQTQLQEIYPDSSRELRVLQRRMYPALKHTLGVVKPNRNDLTVKRIEKVERPDYYVEKITLGRKGEGDQIPALLFTSLKNEIDSPAALLVDEEGKSSWFDRSTGQPGELLQGLLEQGYRVLLPDLFLTGEFHSPNKRTERVMEVRGDHFYTYNQSDTALRVQDIVTCAIFLQSRSPNPKIHLVGSGQAGLWSLLAAPFIESLESVVVDGDGFDTASDELIEEKLFVPGLLRAGGLNTAQALLAPTPLLIHNTQEKLGTTWAMQAYKVADRLESLKVAPQELSQAEILQALRNIRN